MSLARNQQRSNAVSVIEVDEALEPEVMDKLRKVPGILSATGLTL